MIASFLLAYIFIFKIQHPKQSDINNIGTQEQDQVSSANLPARLKIPGIDVDAAVELVGLTPAGDMDTPKKPEDVAWFNLGTRPGEKGSAVITGHYGTWKNGKGSVFDNLHKLRQGDKIFVEDDNGSTTVFVVRESRSYDPSADAIDVFSSNDEKAHLNLTTCEGIWNKDSKIYSERLVVFTDKE